VRVIEQALRDVVAAPGSTSNQDSARLFLAGSPMLKLWCELAALDPARVSAHAGHLMGTRFSAGEPAGRLGPYARPRPIKATI
jgi:hypothetical protein